MFSNEVEIVVFKPGQSGNPLGRTKQVDPRSKDLQEFCKEHYQDIKKVGEIALRHAVKNEEPWAIKICMEYFYPKPGTFVSISTEENTEVNLNFSSTLNYEDQQTFLKLWLKNRKGNRAFASANQAENSIPEIVYEDVENLEENLEDNIKTG